MHQLFEHYILSRILYNELLQMYIEGPSSLQIFIKSYFLRINIIIQVLISFHEIDSSFDDRLYNLELRHPREDTHDKITDAKENAELDVSDGQFGRAAKFSSSRPRN